MIEPIEPGACGFVQVRAFGAAGDGQALDTAAIQAAIDACARMGGGTVLLPPGRYRSGALFLRSQITLQIEAGATLLGSADPADYPIGASRWEGREQPSHASLINGHNLDNVAIVGRGTIDGCGASWWRLFRAGVLAHPRPRLIALADCRNVLISGITAINSPSWTINPVRCAHVQVRQVTIANPADSPNTDGINPDSCYDVHISDCSISVGDDCITLKSGVEDEIPERRAPCRDITITNCTMASGHGGVVIGSEMSGDVRNVVISNCVFVGTDRGIRLKSRRGRGGMVENVRVSNIVMTGVLCPISMNLYYACGAWGDALVADKRAHPVSDATPRFRQIAFSQITARDVQVAAAFVYGLPEMPIADLSLSDIAITMAADAAPGYPDMADDLEPMQQAGVFVANARRVRLHHVEVAGQRGPALMFSQCADLALSASAGWTPPRDAPLIRMRDVAGAFVHGCQAPAQTDVFVQVEGAQSADIVLLANHLAAARVPIQRAPEVPPDAVRSAVHGL